MSASSRTHIAPWRILLAPILALLVNMILAVLLNLPLRAFYRIAPNANMAIFAGLATFAVSTTIGAFAGGRVAPRTSAAVLSAALLCVMVIFVNVYTPQPISWIPFFVMIAISIGGTLLGHILALKRRSPVPASTFSFETEEAPANPIS
jgi:hypothetical protein